MSPKSVLITGCSQGGIGDALAQEFHRRGLTVFATARRLEKLEHLKNVGLNILQLEVTSPESVRHAVAEVTKVTGGTLDYLILNAGMHYWMPFSDHNIETARQMYETNVISIYTVTQPFLPLLLKAKGLIATIGSINMVINPPYQTSYNGCKAAIQAMTDTMRVELAPLGVKVVNVVTGAVNTHLHESEVDLPESSYYVQARKQIESKEMMLQGWRQEPSDYAKKVVDDLLRPSPGPWLWRGGMATLMRWLTSMAPKGWLDGMFQGKESGLAFVTPPSL